MRVVAALFLCLCCSSNDGPECATFVDCDRAEVCLDRMCVPRPDGGPDTGRDAATDAPVDSGADDAGFDVGADAPIDAGVDAGLDVGTDVGADAPIAEHVAFVSSSTLGSNLGGLAGADTTCAMLAADARLVGMFRAILSDATIDARDRISIGGPVVDTSGTVLAADEAELWSGAIRTPLNRDERGSIVGTSIIWTGTDADGTRDSAGGHCGNWGGFPIAGAEAGRTDQSDERWISIYGDTDSSGHACSNESRIYCIRSND